MISRSWQPAATDRSRTGGKARSLFQLIDLGAPVPPFFVVTTDAFRACPDGRLSAALRSAVAEALHQLEHKAGGTPALAVRSSATSEDSADYSFAGVFDTFLNVTGLDDIIEAVEKCWHSHASARAHAYRSDHGLGTDDAMAVIIQQMIPAQWAGVAFTADPVRQALSVTVIDAVTGIGEALVSGLVNPEQIRLARDGTILERCLPPGAEPLPEDIARAVAKSSIEVADSLGFPQDVEWAFAGGQLYLLQTRPITTLAGVFHNRSLENAPDAHLESPDRRWTRAYADEVWTPPISPLFYDVQNLSPHLLTRLGNEGESEVLPPTVFKYHRAAAYADTSVLARVYRNLPPVARRPGLLAQLPADERAAVMDAPFRLWPLLRRVRLFELKHRRRWSFAANHKFLKRSWPQFVEQADRVAEVDVSRLGSADLDRHVEQIWGLALLVGVECEVAVLYHAHDLKLLMAGVLERWLGGGEEIYAAASSGLPDSQTVRESDDLWCIADRIRGLAPAMRNSVQGASYADLADFDDAGIRAIRTDVEAFLRRHRHRGANYKDLIHPRWGDEPDLLWNQIKAMVETPGTRPRDANLAAARGRVEAQAKALESLSGWRSLYRRPLLQRLFAYNEIYAALRDNHRFYYDNVWWLLRRAYREKGRRLSAEGQLDKADDVFFLARAEIEALAGEGLSAETAAARISVRRSEWEETRRRLPPKFLHLGCASLGEAAQSTSSERLVGIPASPGEVRGRARIALDIRDLDGFQAGEILVTRQTDPAWTPAFARLSGLILETGGALAHGASLCREFGLPCVTAVEDATSLIHDGDLLLLSGGEGTVQIIDRMPVAAAAEPQPLHTRSEN